MRICGREQSAEEKTTLFDEPPIHRQINEDAAAAKTAIPDLKGEERPFPNVKFAGASLLMISSGRGKEVYRRTMERLRKTSDDTLNLRASSTMKFQFSSS